MRKYNKTMLVTTMSMKTIKLVRVVTIIITIIMRDTPILTIAFGTEPKMRRKKGEKEKVIDSSYQQ